MNIQLYQLFWCESKGSLGCWQRLDGFSLMIASHLRVGWCLVLVRHTIYIQLVIYLNRHFYNWWPSWCRWRWRRCQTGQVGSPGYSKLWRRAFFLVFDVGLGQIERCRMDVLEGRWTNQSHSQIWMIYRGYWFTLIFACRNHGLVVRFPFTPDLLTRILNSFLGENYCWWKSQVFHRLTITPLAFRWSLRFSIWPGGHRRLFASVGPYYSYDPELLLKAW